jgi:hypothetical protein
LPPDLKDVLETGRRDENHAPAAPLQQRIGADGRATEEVELATGSARFASRAKLAQHLLNGLGDGFFGCGAQRCHLHNFQLSLTHEYAVREGSSSIDCYAHEPPILHHAKHFAGRKSRNEMDKSA